MFDRYFRLSVSDQELSQAAVRRLLGARGDREDLRSQLESLHSRELLNAAVEELGVYESEIEEHQIEPFATAIFDVADLLSDERAGVLEVPVHWRIGFLVNKAVEKLNDRSARVEVLTNAITKTSGLFMAVTFVDLVGTPVEGNTDERILPESGIVKLRFAAVQKIETAAVSGALAQHPKLAVLLGRWQAWGTKEDVASYIEALTQTPMGTLQLLRSLVVRSVRRGLGDYVGTERYYMRRVDIEALLSMDTLDARVQTLPTDGLSGEDQQAIKAFQKAMERRKSGKSDDDPFARD